MDLRMWMYDLAREQAPTMDHLRRLCRLSLESGYNALGIYMEHRFAYPSMPWMHGRGAVQPEMIQQLAGEFSKLQLVPFVNLLGHCEGLLYCEPGKRWAEEPFTGMQACPTNPDWARAAERMLDDVLRAFPGELVHIGGDETFQLGRCERCRSKVAEFEKGEGIDGLARLYGLFFGPLARRTLEAGKRPAMWADMIIHHPQALDFIPHETMLFDWQYFSGPVLHNLEKAAKHDIVFCPSLQTYDAAWFHLPQSERNVRAHVEEHHDATAAGENRVQGVCLTTWESALMGNYETLFPAIRACGQMLSEPVAAKPAHKKSWIRVQGESEDERGPIIRQMQSLLGQAVADAATSVTLAPGPSSVSVKFTSNSVEYEAMALPRSVGDPLIGKLRVLAGMDPANRRANAKGVVTGAVDENEFQFDVESNTTADGVGLALTRKGKPHLLDHLRKESARIVGAYQDVSDVHAEWASLLGIELQACGGMFAFNGWRSPLKCRLLISGNPFLLWRKHGEELCGEVGDRALAITERSLSVAPDCATRGVSEFVKTALEFTRGADQARQAYAQNLPGVAISCLAPARQMFENLEKVAVATHLNIGGSLADIERCKAAKTHVETVIQRIKYHGDGSLGYLPSFEHLTHTTFIPHDQAAWGTVNDWA